MIRAVIGTIVGALLALSAVLVLERDRTDIVQQQMLWGDTPVTWMQRPASTGPVIIITHGFAGSRQLMQAYQISLANAGYVTFSFDFEGHGRNRQQMRGDVTAIDGTTRYLMEELARVTDRAIDEVGQANGLAYLGHSMASDIIIRQAMRDPRVATTAALSVFSLAITSEEPRSLLMINGQWEAGLRAAAQSVMQQIGAREGDRIRDVTGFARAALVAPMTEHIGILYSRAAIAEVIGWYDAEFGITRESPPSIAPYGVIILGGFVGIVMALGGLATLGFGGKPRRVLPITPRAFWLSVLLPALITPMVLRGASVPFLPVILADYLALHLALYGGLAIAILLITGHGSVIFPTPRRVLRSLWIGIGFGAAALGLMGLYLDRYVGSFWAGGARLLPFVMILIGALPAMIADAALISAARAPIWKRILVRFAFLASLGLAVALDFDRMLFLILILPVILLFYASFGFVYGRLGRGQAAVLGMGLALGVSLAWALAASFPLFQAG
ncbi:alpha/beta fold hydrolase [Rhodobacterales bacterium LSUCC0387]|nr:alpha/beta fold hydrolase [Rhodobacterales bacterium LSUCC0387]